MKNFAAVESGLKGKSGEEKPELQALLQSLMITEDEASNEFISVRSRGGLITPCEDIVRILHEAEICFRKEVNIAICIQACGVRFQNVRFTFQNARFMFQNVRFHTSHVMLCLGDEIIIDMFSCGKYSIFIK